MIALSQMAKSAYATPLPCMQLLHQLDHCSGWTRGFNPGIMLNVLLIDLAACSLRLTKYILHADQGRHLGGRSQQASNPVLQCGWLPHPQMGWLLCDADHHHLPLLHWHCPDCGHQYWPVLPRHRHQQEVSSNACFSCSIFGCSLLFAAISTGLYNWTQASALGQSDCLLFL